MNRFLRQFCSGALFVFSFFLASPLFSQNLLSYAGNSGRERFNDVFELSNGKLLVSGQADNLGWLPASTPVTTLTINLAPGFSSITSSDSKVAFIMLLNSTQTTIEHVLRFPANTVADVSRIRTTNEQGSATGTMYISGRRTFTSDPTQDGYYIARLDNNFVGGTPTTCSWFYPVSAPPRGASVSSYKTIQPWDVGNDGSVIFGRGTDYDWNWAAIEKLDANGNRIVVENWPYQTGTNGEQNYKPASAYTGGTVGFSSILLKAQRSGSLRSSVNGTAYWNGYNYNALDENGNARKGKFPDDWFFGAAEGETPGDGRIYGRLTQSTNYNASIVGYRTNFASTRPTARLGSIVIDRRDNHLYFGYSTQSAFRTTSGGYIPDFEPVVVAMNPAGAIKWWARLYDQYGISEPDQYIDALEIDYASDYLVVLARQHGFNVNMFWKGNQLTYNGAANGFKNANSGVNTIQTGHYTWLGKYDLIRVPVGPLPVQPKIYHATYVTEYSDNPSGLGVPSNDPKLDRWPIPNSGFPDLNTTKGLTKISVARNGNVFLVAQGRRTITTSDAHQKMPKPGTGSVSAWNQFIRVYRPDLSAPIYSTLLTGAWDTLTGIGGSNTQVTAAIPTLNGVYVTGYHEADPSSGVARPNVIPVANVPAWGAATPSGESAIFGRLEFVVDNPVGLNLTNSNFCSQSGSNTGTMSFVPPPAFLVSYGVGNQFRIELSDVNGLFAEQGGTTTLLGTVNSTSNTVQNINYTIPIGHPSGNGYGMRVSTTNPVTRGFWYNVQVVNAAPATPGAIAGPSSVCSNTASVALYTINKVTNTTVYQWEISPTVGNQADPCDIPGCAGKISGSDTAGVVVWNPSYAGTATIRVRATNTCGASAWQTFNVTNIAPCITTNTSVDVCAGGNLTVAFTVPAGVTVGGTNQFVAELSDVSGNFPGTDIGTANNISAGPGPLNGTVNATLPGSTVAGSNYRFRVKGISGTTPVVSSLPSSAISTIRNIPVVPGTPTGSNSLCLNSLASNYAYSVSTVSGATSYEWQILPDSAGVVVSGVDPTATITWNNILGSPQLRVRAKNSCGVSAWSAAFTINVVNCLQITSTTPAGPFCASQTGVVANFSIPTGVTFNGGNTLTIEIFDLTNNVISTGLGSITYVVASPSTGSTASFSIPGNLAQGNYVMRLRASNPVRTGSNFAFTVNPSNLNTPGSISGSTTPTCGQTSVAYSIGAVTGATGYIWSLNPASVGTISGSGTAITINFASTYQGGNVSLSVMATGACQNSAASNLSITPGCTAPTAPTVPVPNAAGNFRSRQNGNWFTFNTWESWNGSAWVTATAFPASTSGIIQIQNGHTVNLHWPVNVTSSNSPGLSTTLNAVSVSSGITLNGGIVGNGGAAWRTTDGGITWSTVTTSTVQNLNSVSTFNSGQRILAVGNSGTILRGDGGAANTTGGPNWNAAFTLTANGNGTPITTDFNCVDINGGDGLIVGNDGRMIIATSLGATLNDRTSVIGTSTNLRGCYIYANGGNRQAHIIGDNGYYRNTNQIAWITNPAWNSAQTLSGSPQLNSIAFYNSANANAIGVIVGNGGVIFRTTNSGTTWTTITSPTTQHLLSVRWAANADVFAVGDNGTLINSRDDGATWILVDVGTTAQLRCANPGSASDRNHGFAVGASGTIIAGVTSGGPALNLDQVVVENGATINVGLRDVTWSNGTGMELDVAGTIDMLESPYIFEWANTAGIEIAFRPTGVYRHGRNGGSAQRDLIGRFQTNAPTVYWLPNSLCEIYGVTNSSPFLKALAFSNFTWNCARQSSAITMNNPSLSVGGTFLVQNTNNQTLSHQSASPVTATLNFPTFRQDNGIFSFYDNNSETSRVTLNCQNFVMNGGTFNPMLDRGLAIINVATQFTQTGGTINMNPSGDARKGCVWNMMGHFNQTAGTFSQTNTSATSILFPQSPVFFNASALQNLSVQGTISGQIDLQFTNSGAGFALTGAVNLGTFPAKYISGNLNLGSHVFTCGNLSIRGTNAAVVSTLSGTGQLNAQSLSLVSGIVDNAADVLTVTTPTISGVTGGSRNSHIRGALRKAFDPSVSGSFTFPIGLSSGYKPLTLTGFANDGNAKILAATVAATGANQAAGTKIQNVGTQPTIGGLNWRIRRTDNATGSIGALAGVTLVSDTFNVETRIGQSNTGLTTGFSSTGGNQSKNASLSFVNSRFYDFQTSKPLSLVSIATSGGTYFAIGGSSTVTPPGGGYTVGPSGNYPNLTAVANEYNDVKFTAPVLFTFSSNYNGAADSSGTEVFPIIFRENQTRRVTIRYQGTSKIETSNTSANGITSLISFDGADSITFQGNDQWRFLNKEYGPNTNTFTFINGAKANKFEHLIIEGSDSLKNFSGVVFFSTSNNSQGNSENAFKANKIRSNSDRRLEPIIVGISNNIWPGLPLGSLIDASNTSPIVITTPQNHGFSTGQQVDIEGVHGNYAANGTWTLTSTGLKTFSLNGSAGNGAFRINYFINSIVNNAGLLRITTADIDGNTLAHQVPFDQVIRITNISAAGLSVLGESYFIKSVSATEFDLYNNAAATTPCPFSGSYTSGGQIRFLIDIRLRSVPSASNDLITFGNGSINVVVVNATKLGSGLIQVATSANHQLENGWSVRMDGVTGIGANFEAIVNRTDGWQIDVTSPTTFTLRNSNGANGGTNVALSSYTGGGRFLVSPVIVSSTNHGLTTGNPVTINGVSGIYMTNNTHFVRRLDNNAFSLWTDASMILPRYLSLPGINRLGGAPGSLLNGRGYTGTAVLSRPGLPFYTNRTILSVTASSSSGFVTFTYNVAAGTFGAAGIGKLFYVVVSGVNGFGGSSSPNGEFQGPTGFGRVTATNQFQITYVTSGTVSGSYTSGGTFLNNITIDNITNTKENCNGNVLSTWNLASCNGPNYQLELGPGKRTGIRIGELFTISGVTGPAPNHTLNGNFLAVTANPFVNGSVIFSAMTPPTTEPLINGGGVPAMSADPNPPFNGNIVAAYDLLANKLIFSRNTGNALNENNSIEDNEITNFDSVAVAISPTGNGGGWKINGNSLYNKLSQPPKAGSGANAFQAISFTPGFKSNNNEMIGNHIGGSQPLSAGNAMVFSRGIVFTGFQIDAGNEQVTRIENNVVRNLNAVSFSGSLGGVACIDVLGGRVDVKNNIFGGTDLGGTGDTIITGGGSGAPATFFLRNASTDSVAIVGNSVGHILLPGSVDNIFMVAQNTNGKLLVKGNRFYKMSTNNSFFGRRTTMIRVGQVVSIATTSSNATITWNSHGMATGDFVRIEGSSNTPSNGSWQITVVNANSFTINGYAGTGSSSNNGAIFKLLSYPNLSATIDSNETYHIRITNGGGGQSTLRMMMVYASNAKGIVRKNRFFDNTEVRQCAFMSLYGPTNNPNGWLMYNNQVSVVGISSSFSPFSYGFEMDHPTFTGVTLPRIYFNTVWLRNNSGYAGSNMYGFRKNGSGRTVVRNNVFFVASSTNAGGRAVAAGVSSTANWTGSDFTHNLLYAEGGNAFLGEYQSNLIASIPGWQTFAGSGSTDNIYNYANFEDVQPSVIGNLALSTDNCPIKDKGVNVNIFEDYDSLEVRSKSTPDLGSNEFSKSLPTGAYWIGAVNSDWNNDGNWCDQRVPLETEDVTITNAPAKPFMPVVSTPTAVCRNITIADNPGSMLVIYGPEASLTLGGKTPRINFTYNNLSNINGTIYFVSDSAQNVPGSAGAITGRVNYSMPTNAISNVTYSTGPDLFTITTSGNHNLVVNDFVFINNVKGVDGANGMKKVAEVPNATSFRYQGAGSGTYTANSGRTRHAALLPISNVTLSAGPSSNLLITTPKVHGLSVGQFVQIAGVLGNSEANGPREILTVPSTTTFTIGATSANAFDPDGNAYVLPSGTGYYDLVYDGGPKHATGRIYAASVYGNGGSFNMDAGLNFVRDSVRIIDTASLVVANNSAFGNLLVAGQMELQSGTLTVSDSLTARGGEINLNGGAVVTKNMAVLRGGAINVTSGTTTITDTLNVRHGTMNFADNITAKIGQIRSGGVLSISVGNLTLNDTLAMRGGTINTLGDKINLGRRLNLVSGMINLNNPGTILELTSATNQQVLGGSESSFVQGGAVRHNVSAFSAQTGSSTTITSITGGNPISVNRSAHSLITGDKISIQGVTGFPAANGIWTVTRTDANNFTLSGSNAAGSSGAVGNFVRFGRGITTGTTHATPVVVNSNGHGFAEGDVVHVADVTGNPTANGVWTIGSVSANAFTLSGTNGSGASGANDGTITRLENRLFPIGRGALYQPANLHIAQGFTASTAYTASSISGAPASRGLPGGALGTPSYPGPGTDLIMAIGTSGYTNIAQSPTSNVNAAGVTISYSNADGVLVHNRRNLTILKDSAGFGDWLNIRGNSIDSTSTVKQIRSSKIFNSFSDFVLGYMDQTPLPLSLISFAANLMKEGVKTSWKTVQEDGILYFDVERSLDGRNFAKIGQTKAEGGEEATIYNWLDKDARKLGVSRLYYRLRIVETGNKYAYSQVERVNLDAKPISISLFPNPTKDKVEVYFDVPDALQVHTTITDISGRKVASRILNLETGGRQMLDLSELPSGNYILRFDTGVGVHYHKVVKE